MGIRVLVAAAAVAVGVGQAEAATVDRVKMTLTSEYICEIDPCDGPAPNASSFYGIATNVPITGFLIIGDQDEYGLQSISFTVGSQAHDFGMFEKWAGSYWEPDLASFFTVFEIDWDGSMGSLWYRDDDAPWSLDVQGTIELAPVPLPASAALLPLGIGALAMMRRRRRYSV